MRWRPSRSIQVEDRRGGGGGFGGLGGPSTGGLGGRGIPIPIGGGGIGTIILIVIMLLVFGGGGLGGFGGLAGGGGGADGTLDPNDQQKQFINAVVVDVQTFWQQEFAAVNKQYPETTLVLFGQQTQSGCGVASSDTGPFYCPSDAKVYLDTGFFDELASRFGAPGEFAEAYVIAHEFGHHVQDALGTMDQVAQQQQANPSQANELSVRLELQADCLAGVWANSVKNNPDLENVESITDQDIKQGLDAAAAVGDDRLQQQAGGRVNPETWTHGSSEQRTRWFTNGYKGGTIASCDTFSASSL
jgi:predicted metalloprotease